MTLGELIKKYRDENNLTMQDFANMSGLSKGYISMLEKNRHPQNNKKIIPSIATFNKVANAMRTSVDQLLTKVDNNQLVDVSSEDFSDMNIPKISKGISIPILNTVVAGMPIDAYEDILGYEEINRELASTGEFFALKIKGDSMLPVLQEDDIIIVRQQSDVKSGDIAIVLINGNNATAKKVMKQESGITLIAFNPAVYEPHFYSNGEIESLPVRIAGKVVEMKRSF
ncbi:MAG: LexA family protein [Lentihominibacter sp.]